MQLMLVLLALNPVMQTQAQDSPTARSTPAMSFTVMQTCDPVSQPLVCRLAAKNPQARLVFGSGHIEMESHLQLQALAESLPSESLLILDSMGGTLGGGLKLGQQIRSMGLRTIVAAPQTATQGPDSRIRGACVSACLYAFLGGVERHIAPGARLGIHQFRSKNDEIDISKTQKIVAVLGRYLDQMGISRGLLDAALITPHQSVFWIGENSARKWRVLSNDTRGTQWRLAATTSGDLVIHATGFQSAASNIAAIDIRSAETGPKLTLVMRESHASDASPTDGTAKVYPFALLAIDSSVHQAEAMELRTISSRLSQISFGLDLKTLTALCSGSTVKLRLRWPDEPEPSTGTTLSLQGLHSGLTAILRLSGQFNKPCTS